MLLECISVAKQSILNIVCCVEFVFELLQLFFLLQVFLS